MLSLVDKIKTNTAKLIGYLSTVSIMITGCSANNYIIMPDGNIHKFSRMEQLAYKEFDKMMQCNDTKIARKILYNFADKIGDNNGKTDNYELFKALNLFDDVSYAIVDKYFGNNNKKIEKNEYKLRPKDIKNPIINLVDSICEEVINKMFKEW